MKRLGFLLVIVFMLAGCTGTAQPGAEKPASKSPAIPHEVTENMDCKSCHATGANGAMVTKHVDRPNCINCHKPAAK